MRPHTMQPQSIIIPAGTRLWRVRNVEYANMGGFVVPPETILFFALTQEHLDLVLEYRHEDYPTRQSFTVDEYRVRSKTNVLLFTSGWSDVHKAAAISAAAAAVPVPTPTGDNNYNAVAWLVCTGATDAVGVAKNTQAVPAQLIDELAMPFRRVKLHRSYEVPVPP